MTAPITIRASSWGELFDCAHRWEAKHVLGMRLPASPAALLGTAIHRSTAMFDAGRVDGHPVSVQDAAGELLRTLEQPDEEVDRRPEDPSLAEQKAIGLKLHKTYCTTISPLYEYKAVEATATPLDIEVPRYGVTLRLTGTLDRARIRRSTIGPRGIGICDVKTGRAAVTGAGKAETRGHAAQLGVYELLSEWTTGDPITEPAQIIGLKTSGNAAWGIGVISNAKGIIIGTPESPGLADMAADTLKSGLFRPNPLSRMCHPRYCARWEACRYHQ